MSEYVNIDHPLNTFEDRYTFLCECIENGYSYGASVHEVSMSANLDNTKTAQVRKLMDDHIWEDDQDYSKFEIDLKRVMGIE